MSIKISFKKNIVSKYIKNYVLFVNQDLKINGLNKLSLQKNSNFINQIIKSSVINKKDFLSFDLKNVFKNYGPEPFDKKFNLDYLVNFLKGKKKDIKGFLLDQKFVSGLGNIYVNEILFSSKVKPTRKIKFLKDNEIKEIIKNTKKILSKSIKLGGASIKDFSSSNGKKGSFQQHFRAYAREGEKCSNIDCKEKITRIIISNRSSFYCLSCQK